MKKARFITGLAVTMCALVTAGCAGSTDTQSSSSATTSATVALSVPLDHVHNAAYDTTTKEVVVGTHTGVFLLAPDGSTRRTGSAQDDFMGLAIGGPDRWFASGHPGHDSDAPDPLGLIDSVDGGESWSSVSRSGVSDFHVLAANQRTVVGSDGQPKLQVSTDAGRTWQLGAELAPTSLAFTGDDLLAATEAGLQSSPNNGRTFAAVDGAPSLVLLSASGGALWGVDQLRNVWRSTNGGDDWSQVGRAPGDAAAIAAVDSESAFVVSATTLTRIA